MNLRLTTWWFEIQSQVQQPGTIASTTIRIGTKYSLKYNDQEFSIPLSTLSLSWTGGWSIFCSTSSICFWGLPMEHINCSSLHLLAIVHGKVRRFIQEDLVSHECSHLKTFCLTNQLFGLTCGLLTASSLQATKCHHKVFGKCRLISKFTLQLYLRCDFHMRWARPFSF